MAFALDFEALARELLGQSRSVLPAWFPQGKWRGHEFVVGNLSGEPGESLSINATTGRWADFASGDKGGDLVSLYAAMHRLSQADAARQLETSAGTPVSSKPKTERKRTVIVPVPDSAPRCTCHHYKYGNASAIWEYRDREGRLLGCVARYDPEGERKQIIPFTYARDHRGTNWGMGHWPEPRPLYNLPDLNDRAEAPVLLVEGEKSADAARAIAPHYVAVTWPGGSNAWRKADFSQLHGRTVLLWPDADEPGIKCMWEIGHSLIKQCPTVKIIIPDTKPVGWDAADALVAGWQWADFRAWAVPLACQVTDAAYQVHTSLPTTPSKPNGHATLERTTPSPQSQVGKWLAWGLDRTGNGTPISNLNNAVAVMEHDPTLQKMVWYDEFLQRLMTTQDGAAEPREWTEADDINLALYMQRTIGLSKIGRDIVSQAVIAIAFRDVRNCVRDWLDSLQWDREGRIEQFFEDHFGADANAYTRAASRNFWLSIVARVFRPGCKVDNMIILEGAQGAGKSQALNLVGGQWYAEQHENVTGKGFFEVLQGMLLVEIAELDSFSRADITRVKQVVTCRSDRYRESYGRYARDHPRQCVFVGTTNKDDWNKDETGARRFWPIRCRGDIDHESIKANREQLFAEAVVRFKNHEKWWEMPDADTRREQRDRYQEDPWQEFIERFLYQEKIGEVWYERSKPRSYVFVSEILMEGLGFETGSRISRTDELRVGACLRMLGWQKIAGRFDGKLRKVWKPVTTDEAGEQANGATN